MGNPYVGPILDEIVTIMAANFNTKIAAIDADLPLWTVTSFTKGLNPWQGDQSFPHLMVFPFGSSSMNSQFESSPNFEATWRVATIITAVANDGSELQARLDKYGTAMIQSIVTGQTGNTWTLNQTVDFIDLIEVAFNDFAGQESQQIAGAYFAIWEVRNLYDPTA